MIETQGGPARLRFKRLKLCSTDSFIVLFHVKYLTQITTPSFNIDPPGTIQTLSTSLSYRNKKKDMAAIVIENTSLWFIKLK